MFTEQAPSNDMSREKARVHNIPLFPTVRDALMLGGNSLAVDGVILIGEHGTYPLNDRGQKLYPRFEMFLKVADVFRESGRSVPLYTDKHLSWNWRQARRMVEIARELKIPMLAGSSIPVALRVPAHDVPYGAKVSKAVAISFGGIESYGFHGLEGLQCLIERRHGGETGVAAVQCLEDAAAWTFLRNNGWARTLFDAALARSEARKPGDPKDLVKRPAVFLVDSGMARRAPCSRCPASWTSGRERPPSKGRRSLSQCCSSCSASECGTISVAWLRTSRRCQPATTYPVERTLLTSGMLDYLMESRHRGHARIETPVLAVRCPARRRAMLLHQRMVGRRQAPHLGR